MAHRQLSRLWTKGVAALLPLGFPGLISVSQALWNPVPGALPGTGVSSSGGPRPHPHWPSCQPERCEVLPKKLGFSVSTHPGLSRPLRECQCLSLVWFPSQAQPRWAHKSPSSGLGGGGVALLHGKIKPFVREQGPTLRQAHTEPVPREAKLLSLASLTLL